MSKVYLKSLVKAERRIAMYEVYYRTPVGIALIAADDGYITKLSIRDEELEETTTDSPLLKEAIKQLREYFAGERKEFDLPIKPAGSIFSSKFGNSCSK
jgi:methylated-DNA-[protein]-cysteine S-methyltransferase